MTTVEQLALQAGAAKFYPEAQSAIEQNYVVSAKFLQRFHDLVCEACAAIADNICPSCHDESACNAAESIAEDIRARKDSA